MIAAENPEVPDPAKEGQTRRNVYLREEVTTVLTV
jgi:hypothetical protein